MSNKIASWDTIDFSSSSDEQIKQVLEDLNIPLKQCKYNDSWTGNNKVYCPNFSNKDFMYASYYNDKYQEY